MSKNIQNSTLQTLGKIEDPNEFIAAARRIAAEENNLPVADMFPFPEDAREDVIYSFMGIWLAMSADLPIRDREQVVTQIDRMVAALEKIKTLLPEDPDELERELLQCLRQSIAPRLWEI
jgi:hypothetical protein